MRIVIFKKTFTNIMNPKIIYSHFWMMYINDILNPATRYGKRYKIPFQ